MKKYLIFLFLVVLSCVSDYELILDKNENLILKEILTINKIGAPNGEKTPYQNIAHNILIDYKKLRNLISDNKKITDSSLVQLLDAYIYMHLDTRTIRGLLEINNIDNKTAKIIQLQYIILYTLKELREFINNTNFSANLCFIESIKEDNNIKLIIRRLDTMEHPNIMIGQLDDHLEFRDSFIRPKIKKGFGYIPISNLKNHDSIEGLYLIPLNDGTIDTLRFKSKIK